VGCVIRGRGIVCTRYTHNLGASHYPSRRPPHLTPRWFAPPVFPTPHPSTGSGAEAEALEAQAAAAAAAALLNPVPRAPRTYKRRKGYVLLGEGETVGPSSEPLPITRQRRNPVRLSYAEEEDDGDGPEEGHAALSKALWKRKSKHQRGSAAWGGLDLAGVATEGGGEGTEMRGSVGAGGMMVVDISRFYQESPKVLEWIKGEGRGRSRVRVGTVLSL